VYDYAPQEATEVRTLMLEFRRSKGSGKTVPVFKLSAQMVDLSLQNNQRDSLLTDIPAHFPLKSEYRPPETKVQLISASGGSTPLEEAKKEEEKKATQLDRNTEVLSGLLRASRELLRIAISRISDQRVKIHDSRLWTSIGIVALALLAFGAVYGFRGHHSHSVKSHSQIPAAVQQPEKPLVPATTITSEDPHHNAPTVAPSKSKSRHRSDYIAKDTYVYYGKAGKPSH
jgi:hypothetical protein